MTNELRGAPLYALIDRMRDLQKRQNRLRWIPFTARRRAAIEEEIVRINRIMCPPVWCKSAGMWVG